KNKLDNEANNDEVKPKETIDRTSDVEVKDSHESQVDVDSQQIKNVDTQKITVQQDDKMKQEQTVADSLSKEIEEMKVDQHVKDELERIAEQDVAKQQDEKIDSQKVYEDEKTLYDQDKIQQDRKPQTDQHVVLDSENVIELKEQQNEVSCRTKKEFEDQKDVSSKKVDTIHDQQIAKEDVEKPRAVHEKQDDNEQHKTDQEKVDSIQQLQQGG